MSSERSYSTILEFKHNSVALDIDTILPWVEDESPPSRSQARVFEALLLSAWKLESLGKNDTFEQESINDVRNKLLHKL